MKLEQKVAIVTGGAQGLGRGFAEAVIKRGGQVCITDIKVDKGLDTARELEEQYGPGAAIFIRSDVTNNLELEHVFNKTQQIFGRIDIVVNNAGISDEEQWEKMLDINLRAVIAGSKMAVERMSRSQGGNGGVVVNIASTAGLTAVPFIPVYTASKFGVVGLTRSLGATLENTPEERVRVTCLCPSFTNTAMGHEGGGRLSQLLGQDKVTDPKVASWATLNVMEIEDVVNAFLKLVDDADNQGAVMDVTPKGMRYRYPRRLQSRL